MHVAICGYAHTKFGKLDLPDAEALIGAVARDALDHASCAPEEIDAIFLGAFNNGFSRQDFQAGLVALAVPELRHTPATRVENACATGSAAIHAGLSAIRSGAARRVLVIGAEKMTAVPGSEVGDILQSSSYVPEEGGIIGGFAGLFGHIANAYFQEFGDRSASLARIAAKNHANGAMNPFAHMQKDVGLDFCNTVSERNPLVAGPLRRTDCSLVSDGAAALVLSAEDAAPKGVPLVRFRAARQVNDFMPLSRRSSTEFVGAKRAWNSAYEQAGLSLDDLSFVETHDCFTIAELLQYEAMGLAP